MSYDLIIKGAEVVTASEVTQTDIGIRDGLLAALGKDMGEAMTTIDAQSGFL